MPGGVGMTKALINIVDIIDHRGKYSTQRMLVVDRMPKLVYERKGRNWLQGHDSGCFGFYGYEKPGPNWQAFGGRKFSIPMIDGSVIEASGQWWDPGTPVDFSGLVYSDGMNTIDALSKCYVFIGGIHIDCEIVDTWLADNEASNNYHRYDIRHVDHGKHTITSRWGQEALA
jgi:hypothetical protein